MKKYIFVLAAFLPLILLSCDFVEDEGGGSGKYTKPTTGLVTHYPGAGATSVAYYAPEVENGWYQCAVSENKIKELPPQSAIEITYNGKKINVLITDLCPNSTNSHWTSKSNYFFDLSESAFSALDNLDKGFLEVTFKMIPYPTKKNIYFQAKDGINPNWLAGRFYNMRYPLAKVEYSNGGGFKQMERLDGIDNNWWVIRSGSNLMSNMTFRLTDVYGHTVTTNKIGSLSENGNYDTGVNFPY